MFLFKSKANAKKVTDKSKTRRIEEHDGVLSYQVGNLQKIGSRSNQEDSFALVNALDVNEIIENGLFAIVADGMGGMKDGKLVSEAAVQSFVQVFRNLDRNQDIVSQLVESVHQVNSLLYDKFNGDGGTTVVLVLIYQGNAYWISVGDSSLYLKRNGILIKLNKEHTYLNELYLEELHKKTIQKDIAESNIDGVRLSEFLGKNKISEVDYNRKPLKLYHNDKILLCSDGISSYLEERSISEALEYSPEISCELLRQQIEGKNHKRQDNYTAVVISCVN